MANSTAKKESNKRYNKRNPDKVRKWWRLQEEKRGYRDRAAYMRDYRRRKKLEKAENQSSD